MAESCCEASNDQWKQGLVEQGGVAQFEESSPLAQKNIIKVLASWPDINEQQRILCGQFSLYLLLHGCSADVSSSTTGMDRADMFLLVLSPR